MNRPSKNFIKHLLIKWLGKIDKIFFEYIWKKRNDDMLLWENNHNITKSDKTSKVVSSSKSKPRSKEEIRERNKINFSGKKRNSVHILDEQLYDKIKSIFGLIRSNFHRDTDKKIFIYRLDLVWCVYTIHGDIVYNP
jgi:hypothetical protein